MSKEMNNAEKLLGTAILLRFLVGQMIDDFDIDPEETKVNIAAGNNPAYSGAMADLLRTVDAALEPFLGETEGRAE